MYDCKTLRNAENIKSVLLEIAHTQIIQKPTFVRNCMEKELTNARLDKSKVENLYARIVPTNKKVVLLEFSEAMDTLKLETAKHLKRYVNDMDREKLGLFLRFCTGSNLLTTEKIHAEFARNGKTTNCSYVWMYFEDSKNV
ncbi:hypothetical protein KP79_PYT25977 [Mizuhopecten yessoensis]|uniref:Uncharacterized protein n=1 Tax=Mizuhopecten yessoensis TaxID=6573 RepID=A0A210PK01_MIZYE|nr:hypothetical protein KP79_PYT25977 [Mizuhopecten yessoensis]